MTPRTVVGVDPRLAYEGSYYTIIGAGGDLAEWIAGYEGLLAEDGIGKPVDWFTLTGADVNTYAGLDVIDHDDAFRADLTFLMFPLDGLDVGRLAMFKLANGDRWFDDVVDNMRPYES